MDDISRALKVSGRFGISERVGLMLMDESASSGIIPGVVGRASTVAKKTDVNQLLKKIPEGKLDAFSGHENKLADFLSLTGDDGVRLINAMDDATLNKLFSLSIDGVTDKQLLGFKSGLVRLHKLDDISDSDITSIIDNTYSLRDVIGIDRFVERTSTAKTFGNFKGLSNEADSAVRHINMKENVVEISKEISDFPKTDIDVLIKKSDDSYKIIETKDIDRWDDLWPFPEMNNELGDKIKAFTTHYGDDVEIEIEFKGKVPEYVKEYIAKKKVEGYNIELVEVI